MKKIYHIILIIVVLVSFSACKEEPDPKEKYSYNAFFVYPAPEDKKVYVGTVTGLSTCKYIVGQYYTKRSKTIEGKWDYICCLRTEEESCVEQHRYGE